MIAGEESDKAAAAGGGGAAGGSILGWSSDIDSVGAGAARSILSSERPSFSSERPSSVSSSKLSNRSSLEFGSSTAGCAAAAAPVDIPVFAAHVGGVTTGIAEVSWLIGESGREEKALNSSDLIDLSKILMTQPSDSMSTSFI